MYVACPSCKSLYSITAAQLSAAGGQVRCAQCQTVFNALEAVFDTPQQALAYEHAVREDVAQEIDELVGRALDQVSGIAEIHRGESQPDGDRSAGQQPEVEPQGGPDAAAPEQSGATADAGLDIESLEAAAAEAAGASGDTLTTGETLADDLRWIDSCADADHYAQPVGAEFVAAQVSDEGDVDVDMSDGLLLHPMCFADPPEPRTHWWAIAAGLLLTVTLLAQYAWWDRNRLAQISALRPALDWLCRPIDCNLPLRHDIAKVEMVEREVRDHPNVKDALLVSAAFINRAVYPQAYPVLQIAFSDISGTPLAVRRFMPEEYLHGKNPRRGMAPGEQTLVLLEVVDPGERAVSFQFDFM